MNNFYFIGIKGTGMAALALILDKLGHNVSGCDLTKHFFTEDLLVENNIEMQSFEEAVIPDDSIVIIGNAFLEDFPLVVQARKNNKCYRYHEYLGLFMENYHTICVTGSHGKTTTTGMLSSMISNFDKTGYLIGDGSGKIEKDTKYFCVEADEYRRHFLAYYPNYAIITNIEIDHVDYFKTEEDYQLAYQEFVEQVKEKVLIFGDDENCRKIKDSNKLIWYGINDNNDIQAKNIVETTSDMSFDLYYLNEFKYRFNLNLVGRHLLWNALGVIGIGILENIPFETIEEGINLFKGVKRRFVIEEHKENVFIDDYAHHPTEVVSDKISALLTFFDEIALHITRPIRWDSDHVVLFDDETKEIAREIVRCGIDKVNIALDYFDASINRVAAWVIGYRNVQKALLYGLLQPIEQLKKLQEEQKFTELMVKQEELKTMPFNEIWDEYCNRCNVPKDGQWFEIVEEYERKVLSKRTQ